MKHKIISTLTCKNEAWIIEKTISVLAKFSHKVIVYDDGSEDNTEEICRSHEIVDWRVRPPHNPLIREEAKQRKELIDMVKKYSPDYVLTLDADEIPTPSIIPFLENIDSSVGLWRSRMINLWQDENNYRVDSYTTAFGTSVNWNPFGPEAWFKYPLMKYDPDIDYTYRLDVQKGGCSSFHPSPENSTKPVQNQEDFYIIHYGKLAEDYLNGERFKFYSKIEELDGKGAYEHRMRHHLEHNRTDTLLTKICPDEWFWQNSGHEDEI